MIKTVTITRKIQLNIVSEGQDVKEVYTKLYDWNEKIFRAANTASTHMYWQAQQREFFYLSNEANVLLSDSSVPVEDIKSEKTRKLVEDGAIRLFNTSQQNTTYRVLSEKLKGDVPSDIFANLNSQLAQTFAAESKDYFSGKRSLRSYKRNLPIPFSAKSIRNITLTEDKKNYSFDLFGISLRTYFGKDLSGNKIIFESALAGEYKLCASSIQLDGKKLFLLAVFQFEATELKGDKEMFAELGLVTPIIAHFGKKPIYIGTKEEFLHQRLAIQAALRRSQIAARFNSGGRGIKHKTKNIEHFKEKEKDYVQTKMHQYSRKLVDLCVSNKCGKLILKFTPDPIVPDGLSREEKEIWRESNEFLLRNWTYYGLVEKLKYKCAKVGIEVIVEKK